MAKNRGTAYALFFLFITIFFLIVVKGLVTAQPGDENVYYYMGKLASEGKIPYKDFFFAHPPLHIYLMALIYKIFGFNIIILKSIPLISTLISAFFVFKITKERFGNAEAVTASLLFLSSYSIMFNSVFSFGVEIAAMLLISGLYFLWNRENYAISGILFGLAGITRLLSLVPISVIFIAVLFSSNSNSSKKNFLKLSSAFFIVFLLANGIFAIMFGNAYLAPVYKFHLLKNFGGTENFKEYSGIVKLNWILFSSALLFVFAENKKPLSALAAASIVYLLFLIALKKIFGFYFVVIFPFLAVIGGYSIVRIFKKLNLPKKWSILVLAILFLIFSWDLASNILFLEKIGFTGFERGKDLAGFIALKSSENTVLFGDDSAVPLLALMTGRKIALDFIDTNNQVFISGLRDLNHVLADLKGKDVIFIIRGAQGISYFSNVREFLNNECGLLGKFHDKIEGDYIIYRCG